jgi:hypothetical protein
MSEVVCDVVYKKQDVRRASFFERCIMRPLWMPVSGGHALRTGKNSIASIDTFEVHRTCII